MTLVATSALLNVVVFKHGREVPYIGDISAEKRERQGVVTYSMYAFLISPSLAIVSFILNFNDRPCSQDDQINFICSSVKEPSSQLNVASTVELLLSSDFKCSLKEGV